MDPLVAQTVKNLPSIQETEIQSLGQDDSLKKEMAIHLGFLAWRIPWPEVPTIIAVIMAVISSLKF